MKLSATDIRVLRAASQWDRHGCAVATGRVTRLRDVERLVARGLMSDAGMAIAVDGDGFTRHPERRTRAWRLTDAGRAALERFDAEDAERMKAGGVE